MSSFFTSMYLQIPLVDITSLVHHSHNFPVLGWLFVTLYSISPKVFNPSANGVLAFSWWQKQQYILFISSSYFSHGLFSIHAKLNTRVLLDSHKDFFSPSSRLLLWKSCTYQKIPGFSVLKMQKSRKDKPFIYLWTCFSCQILQNTINIVLITLQMLQKIAKACTKLLCIILQTD